MCVMSTPSTAAWFVRHAPHAPLTARLGAGASTGSGLFGACGWSAGGTPGWSWAAICHKQSQEKCSHKVAPVFLLRILFEMLMVFVVFVVKRCPRVPCLGATYAQRPMCHGCYSVSSLFQSSFAVYLLSDAEKDTRNFLTHPLFGAVSAAAWLTEHVCVISSGSQPSPAVELHIGFAQSHIAGQLWPFDHRHISEHVRSISMQRADAASWRHVLGACHKLSRCIFHRIVVVRSRPVNSRLGVQLRMPP